MDKFVVGFAYTNDGRVLLMEKRRPKWQRGFLNGIGGKMEADETPRAAMTRESMEEAGLDLEWAYRGILRGLNYDGRPFECHLFYAYDARVKKFKQMEDEALGLYQTSDIHNHHILNHLNFLIPFGLCNDRTLFMQLDYW
ncbi:MAG: NUDIX hydrolase [Desulfobacterales bacterium]|nr:NUDIX hydrolase [Desulfobacterales bacterium]